MIIHISGQRSDLLNSLAEVLSSSTLTIIPGNRDLIDHPAETEIKLQNNYQIKAEGYRIEQGANTTVFANDNAGFLYGLNHLKAISEEFALLELNAEDVSSINESPKFEWRGLHLDVARHFFEPQVIKRLFDKMTDLRLNRFHWHLTDDQGWRVEIPEYPLLVEQGAFRREQDGTEYGGYYTRSEIHELLEYARLRNITVVPEFDLPGHSMAALAGYPQYSCTGKHEAVPSTWGIFKHVFCPGKDGTVRFLRGILDSLMDLFDGPYIHLGGDECPVTRWENCPDCDKRMYDEKLTSARELQGWLLGGLINQATQAGKRVIGWDEILDLDSLPESAIVMAWQSVERGVMAADRGLDVIMCPREHCYFDYAQAESGEPKSFPAVLTLEDVKRFNPLPKEARSEVSHHFLGGQANVWTEYIESEDHLNYMLFPRLNAMAERLWGC